MVLEGKGVGFVLLLIDLCVQLAAAKSQREAEVERGEGLTGTIGYEMQGCYDCDGFRKDCYAYVSQKDLNKYKPKNI